MDEEIEDSVERNLLGRAKIFVLIVFVVFVFVVIVLFHFASQVCSKAMPLSLARMPPVTN